MRSGMVQRGMMMPSYLAEMRQVIASASVALLMTVPPSALVPSGPPPRSNAQLRSAAPASPFVQMTPMMAATTRDHKYKQPSTSHMLTANASAALLTSAPPSAKAPSEQTP